MRTEALTKIIGVVPAFMRPRKFPGCSLASLVLSWVFSLRKLQRPRQTGFIYPGPSPRHMGL